MSLIVLMENSSTARTTLQVARCGGLAGVQLTEVADLPPYLTSPPTVVFAPAHLAEAVLAACAVAPETHVLLYTDVQDTAVLALAARAPQLTGILGLRYPGAPPRPWEWMALARRFVDGTPPPAHAPLAWGHQWCAFSVGSTEERDAAVAEVERFAGDLLPGHRCQAIAELAHELLMNAMYDAPVDAAGTAVYAHQRKEAITLPPQARPVLGFGSDGLRLVVTVQDPFGRLTRDAVFSGLHRGLAHGAMDQAGGGAGLGFFLIYQAVTGLFIDIIPGQLTQVTTVLELDVPVRELRKLPRSLHVLYYQGSQP